MKPDTTGPIDLTNPGYDGNKIWDLVTQLLMIAADTQSIRLPGVVEVPSGVLQASNSLSMVEFPNAETAGDYTFYQLAPVSSFTLPKLRVAGLMCFAECTGITEAEFPELVSMGDSCFAGCVDLTTVSFPKLTRVPDYAFSGCSSLHLYDDSFPLVTAIGADAFEGCADLTYASFPSIISLDDIGDDAFASGQSGVVVSLNLEGVTVGSDAETKLGMFCGRVGIVESGSVVVCADHTYHVP